MKKHPYFGTGATSILHAPKVQMNNIFYCNKLMHGDILTCKKVTDMLHRIILQVFSSQTKVYKGDHIFTNLDSVFVEILLPFITCHVHSHQNT